MLLAAALLVLVPPVQGPVVRAFDFSGPFRAGHRGADLAAPPGAPVRAPCAGSVAFAGPAASNGRVVTLLCGRWRVTHLPLAEIAVREGARVEVGEPLGTVGAGAVHTGLHLGVRRAGSRSGYVDPLRFLGRAAPPLGPAPPPGGPPRAGPARPLEPRPPAAAPPLAVSGPAPWPAWAGLALVLAGAGLGRRARRRRVRTRSPAPAGASVQA